MQMQVVDMCMRRALTKGRETLAKLEQLSDEQLERAVGNHITNPIKRAYTHLFVGGTTSLWGRNEDLSYQFNDTYVPTVGEYEIATKILEKRRHIKSYD